MKPNDAKKNVRSAVFSIAWNLFCANNSLGFGECLHRAWNSIKAQPENQRRIEAAKTAAGITEETDSWNNWKLKGYEVIHGSKALFGCDLIYALKGDDAVYKARFFGRSQVQPISKSA